MVKSTRNAAAVEEFPQPQSFAGNGDVEKSLIRNHAQTIGERAMGCQTSIEVNVHRTGWARRVGAF